MKKIILTCLSVVVLASSVFSGTAAYAAENDNVNDNTGTANDVTAVVEQQDMTVPSFSTSVDSNINSTNGGVSTLSVPSYISKKTLRWAINNTTTITNVVGKYFGKTAAKKVGSVMHTYVKPVLRKLEALDKVTYDKLEDALYSAMKGPLGATTAKIGAKAIVEVIQIVAPI